MSIRRAVAPLVAALLASAPAGAHAQPAGATMQVVAGARIAALADRIARALVHDADRALAPAFTILDQNVPAGAVALNSGAPQINPTYVTVPVAIAVDGRIARTVFAGFRITSYVRTAVAAHDLAADAILNADDLISARVPFAGRPGLEPAAFIGRKVRSIVARGAVVYPESTAVNEIVRAGMPAVLIVRDGSVALAADVVARTSGGLGDFVTIFNPQTQKALSGVVTGPNTVELTLPGVNE